MAKTPTAPRLAGLRLRAVARLLQSPVAGNAIAKIVVRQMGLARLRDESLPDAEVPPVIHFRASPSLPKEPADG